MESEEREQIVHLPALTKALSATVTCWLAQANKGYNGFHSLIVSRQFKPFLIETFGIPKFSSLHCQFPHNILIKRLQFASSGHGKWDSSLEHRYP
jgi:hypothetical protein